MLQGILFFLYLFFRISLFFRVENQPFREFMHSCPSLDSTSWGGKNVFDVYSKSQATALDGTKGSDW